MGAASMEQAGTQSTYLPLLVFAGMAAGMALAPLILARLWALWMGVTRPNPVKNAVYECGLETRPSTSLPIKIEYYIYGIIFLVFDVEVLFLLPLATAYRDLSPGAVLCVLLFVLLLLEGLAWAWMRGFLTWMPPFEPTRPSSAPRDATSIPPPAP